MFNSFVQCFMKNGSKLSTYLCQSVDILPEHLISVNINENYNFRQKIFNYFVFEKLPFNPVISICV